MYYLFLQLSREYNIQCCNLYYPVLKQHIQYEFDPCDNDQVDRLADELICILYLSIEEKVEILINFFF